MSAIGSILPILILLCIIAVLFLFGRRQWKITRKPVSKPGNKLVIGYAVILVIGLIVFFFAQRNDGEEVEFDKIPSIENMETRYLQEDAKDYVAQKWEFAMKQKTLAIKRDVLPWEHKDDDGMEYDDEWDDDEVNVNEIPVSFGYTDTDKVTVTYYKTPAVFSQGLDITQYIGDPRIDIKKDKIVINMPHTDEELEYSVYKQEFSMLQFSKNSRPITDWMDYENNSTFFHRTEQCIYIQVPEGIKIDADDELWTQ